jgi:hypothetical protein
MNVRYGVDAIEECDSIISNIKDMLLELDDVGLMTVVGYTPMTLSYRDTTPKIMAEISFYINSSWFFITLDVKETVERIKDYVSSMGYVCGDGKWESSGKMIYQILIQK